LKALTEKFSTGVVKRAATKPKKRKRPEKMLMKSRPVARDAEIKGHTGRSFTASEQKADG
jgi:hypothetical protein